MPQNEKAYQWQVIDGEHKTVSFLIVFLIARGKNEMPKERKLK